MAYRKTEKVLAQLEAKRSGLIAASIDVIEKHGLDGLTTDLVCERAGVAAGLLYRYFPDKTELLAAVVAHWLERDLAAMKAASNEQDDPVSALCASIAVSFDRMVSPRIIRSKRNQPAYCITIRDEFSRLIRLTGWDYAPNDRRLLASLALGAIFSAAEAAGSPTKSSAAVAIKFVLRGIGIADIDIRKFVNRRYPFLPASKDFA